MNKLLIFEFVVSLLAVAYAVSLVWYVYGRRLALAFFLFYYGMKILEKSKKKIKKHNKKIRNED